MSNEQVNATWIPDKEIVLCQLCLQTEFNFFKRRHHCRLCGRVTCSKCSNKTMLLSKDDSVPDMPRKRFALPTISPSKQNSPIKQRVCDACYEAHGGSYSSPAAKTKAIESPSNTSDESLRNKANTFNDTDSESSRDSESESDTKDLAEEKRFSNSAISKEVPFNAQITQNMPPSQDSQTLPSMDNYVLKAEDKQQIEVKRREADKDPSQACPEAFAIDTAAADDRALLESYKIESELKFAALARLQAEAKAQAILDAEAEAEAEALEQQEKLRKDLDARDRRRQNEAHQAEKSAKALESALRAKRQQMQWPSSFIQTGKVMLKWICLIPMLHMLHLVALAWSDANALPAAQIVANLSKAATLQLPLRLFRRGICIPLSLSGYSLLTAMFLIGFLCAGLISLLNSLALSHVCPQYPESWWTPATVDVWRAQMNDHLTTYYHAGMYETWAFKALKKKWQ